MANEHVTIILVDSGTYSLARDYELSSNIYFDVDDAGRFVINGNNHTISTIGPVFFNAEELVLKDFTFIFKPHSSQAAIDSAIGARAETLSIQNVHVISEGTVSFDNENFGLFVDAFECEIINSSVSNFAIGVFSSFFSMSTKSENRIMDDSSFDISGDVFLRMDDRYVNYIPQLNIDSCDLGDNAFSIYGIFNGDVSNTKLSSVMLMEAYITSYAPAATNYSDGVEQKRMATSAYLNLVDNNDYGDAKIVRVGNYNFDDFSEDFIQEVFDNSIDKKYLYFISEGDSQIDLAVKKKEAVNIQAVKNINFLDYFVELDDINIRDYTFSVSDKAVTNIEKGEVVFLKVGEVDVVATNRSTGEKYTLRLKLEDPKNPKTINSLHIIFGVFVLMFIIMSSMIMRKRNI